MIKLFSNEEYVNAKSNDLLALKCEHCGEVFYRPKKEIKYAEKPGNEKRCRFCSQICGVRHAKETVKYACCNCGKEFYLQHRFLIDGKNHFCSQSCAATYNNRHKKFGTKVSKLEKYLAKKIEEKYSNMRILLNEKSVIGSEIDIYIPSLKLGFEINGIFHYMPIFGEETFKKIVENDRKKIEACKLLGIDLCVINVSSQKYFKEATSEIFVNEVFSKIEEKLKIMESGAIKRISME